MSDSNSSLFTFPPTVNILRSLSPHDNLSHSTSLRRVLRKYFYLRTFFSEGFANSEYCLTLLKLHEKNQFLNNGLIQEKDWSESFQFNEWAHNLNIRTKTDHPIKNYANDTKTKKSPEQVYNEQKIANLELIREITSSDLLFVLNDQDENEWCQKFLAIFYKVNEKELAKLLDEKPFEFTETDLKKDNNFKNFRNDFGELAKQKIIQSAQNKGSYCLNQHLFPQWLTIHNLNTKSSIVDYKQPESSSQSLPEMMIDRNYDLGIFIEKFGKPQNKRLLFASEYIVPDSSLTNNIFSSDVLKILAKNWFNNSEIKPLKIFFKKKKSSEQKERIIYPVTFFYIRRAPYLYAMSDEMLSNIDYPQWNWDAYRIDRIVDLEILDWNDAQISSSFKELNKTSQLPTPDDVDDKLDREIIGYAFWKPIKWMILRFESDHYQEYIKETSRSPIYQPININNLNQEITNKFTQEEINELKQNIKSDCEDKFNQEKYVFCLAKYYEGDSEVKQRILSWGKKVTVILPFQLKQEIFTEIKTTFELY